MAQAFVTTTQNDYRFRSEKRTPLIDPEKNYKICYGKDEDWYKSETFDITDIKDFHKMELAMRNLSIKNMSTTTYRLAYCRDWIPPGIIEEEKPKEEGEFQLLDTFKPTYKKNKEGMKLIPPVQTTRNVFGYLVKSRMFLPKSTFQDSYGQLGFDLLEKAQERLEAQKRFI